MDKGVIKRIANWLFWGIPTYKISVEVKPNITGKQLLNKNVLITGGSRGIGFAIAKKCIEEGANVLICGRNLWNLKRAQVDLGERCSILEFDVKCVEQMSSFYDKAFSVFNNKIDCLVNNAGISYHEGSFRNVTEKGFDEQFEINFKASYFMAKYFIEKIESFSLAASEKNINILFVSSERGSSCEDIPYGLSKATINSFVGALAKRLGANGYRVNAISPGVTASDMTGNKMDGNYYSETSPNKRIFHPAEMAEVASFLLSDTSSCISGEVIHCDAGKHLTKLG